MNTHPYVALVALDWGDTSHAFAWQKTGSDKIERGSFAATPEALHLWLENLREACAGQAIALAVEAGRNSLLHALLAHPWLTIYPIHSATSAQLPPRLHPVWR